MVFRSLTIEEIREIVDIQLKRVRDQLKAQSMSLEVTQAAKDQLIKLGWDPAFGARPLKRAIQHRIENPVAKLILQGKFGPKDVIPIDVEGGELSFGRVVH